MNEGKIDLLDGLFAFDTGCQDSGIKDDSAKERLKSDPDLIELLTALAKRYLNNDDYTIEDVKKLIDWAVDGLEVEI